MTQTTLDLETRQRLARQTAAVWDVMQDGQWRTFRQIQDSLSVHASEASISARLRELRSLGHQIDRRQKPSGPKGLHEYRAWPK